MFNINLLTCHVDSGKRSEAGFVQGDFIFVHGLHGLHAAEGGFHLRGEGGSGRRLPPTNTTGKGWTANPWSKEGPQPDNKEGLEGGSEEACLAFQDSTFHDLPCSLAR